MLNIKILYSFIIALLLLFSACGEEENKQENKQEEKKKSVQKGQLIDSAIRNVEYTTNSISGLTNFNGTFNYNDTDKTITFRLGNLIIAKNFKLSKLNNDNKILPADIIGVNRKNTTDERIIKLLRVLQSLDNDGNANNGIFIDDNTKGYLNAKINLIDANISTLKNIVKKTGKIFISRAKAREHYKRTLKNIDIKPESAPFTTVWRTTILDKNITIPIDSNYTYNYTVDWGDGEVQKNIRSSITHTYTKDGNHIVKISEKFPAIRMISKDIYVDTEEDNKTTIEKANAKKLQKITQWGDIKWNSFRNAFAYCSSLDIDAKDTPYLSDVDSTKDMFYYAESLRGNKYFNDWNISSITDIYGMFNGAKVFNQPLNSWEVSNVTDMSYIFYEAEAFDQPLNDWNISSVTSMRGVFYKAKAFNQSLKNWDVSSVTDMKWMFYDADSFNRSLNNWDVGNVTNMNWMFGKASAFKDQNLSSWEVSKIPLDKHEYFMQNAGDGNIEPNWRE